MPSKIGLRRAVFGGFAALTLGFFIIDTATPAAAGCGYGAGYAYGHGEDGDGYQLSRSYPRPAIGGYRRRPAPIFVERHVTHKPPIDAAHPGPVVPPVAAVPAAHIDSAAAALAPAVPATAVAAAAPAPGPVATPVVDASDAAPVAENKDQAPTAGCTLADKTRAAATNDAGSRSLIVSACK